MTNNRKSKLLRKQSRRRTQKGGAWNKWPKPRPKPWTRHIRNKGLEAAQDTWDKALEQYIISNIETLGFPVLKDWKWNLNNDILQLIHVPIYASMEGSELPPKIFTDWIKEIYTDKKTNKEDIEIVEAIRQHKKTRPVEQSPVESVDIPEEAPVVGNSARRPAMPPPSSMPSISPIESFYSNESPTEGDKWEKSLISNLLIKFPATKFN